MKTCKTCPNIIKCHSLGWCKNKPISLLTKAKLGKVQIPLPEESAKVYERDSYRCIFCHSQSNLHPHHVHWKTEDRIYNETRNLAENMCTLCFDCHRKLHDGDTRIDLACGLYLEILKKNCL